MAQKRHFSQKEKYAILMSAKDIGVDKAAEIAGLHYTTVYTWRSKLAAMGKEAYLNYKPARPGRGVKQITDIKCQLILPRNKTGLHVAGKCLKKRILCIRFKFGTELGTKILFLLLTIVIPTTLGKLGQAGSSLHAMPIFPGG